MKVVTSENAEHYKWGGNCDGWHFLKSDNLSVIQEIIPMDFSEKKHYHNFSEQFFYVIHGIATFEYENEIVKIRPNQGIHVSAGKVHKISNLENENLFFLVVSTPPSHGDRVNVD